MHSLLHSIMQLTPTLNHALTPTLNHALTTTLGVRGGIELAFMSTTTDREVALLYAQPHQDGQCSMVFEIQMGMRLGCTYALMHSCTPALMHSCTHALMHSCTHALLHSCTHALMHSCTHALMHSCTHALMHSCTPTLLHSYIRTFPTRTRIHSCRYD
jgi:hypothetical protein